MAIKMAPADNTAVAPSTSTTFDWTFNDPDAGDTQSEYAIVKKEFP